MVTATITSKGQITIPKSVRDAMRLRSGDRVDIVVRRHNEAVPTRGMKSIDEVCGMLYRPGERRRTIVEMDEAIAHRMMENE